VDLCSSGKVIAVGNKITISEKERKP